MCPVSLGTSNSARVLETGEAKLWLLLIGVDRYNDARLPALRYSALDCRGVSEALKEATQTFPKKEIWTFHDADTQTPTLAKVMSSLQQISSNANPQDTVFIYFSGHGILDPLGEQPVLCLADTRLDNPSTGLSLRELLECLETCAARQQIVLLDACHSGGMTWRGGRGEESKSLNPTLQLVEGLRRRAAQSRGFYAILSCDREQQSWEFPQLEHGVFSYFLMRGLRGEAADSQGVIEADRLYRYVYYQTLQYIDKTNQQLRLINQQKSSRGEKELYPEYPLQTPKRIVEGVGELIIGVKPPQAIARHPRQALIVDGLSNSQTSLAIGRKLRGTGIFELDYLPRAGKNWMGVQTAINQCLHNSDTSGGGNVTTTLLYLRGRVEQAETGEALLVLGEETRLSRSWLRQALRRTISQQIIILDCPGARDLADWIEDLQIQSERGQCLIAAAAPRSNSEAFASALLETMVASDAQAGLSVAGWIAQLQRQLSENEIVLHTWLSSAQGAIELLPAKINFRDREITGTGQFDLNLCPYMGLKAFSEEDSPFFFGREALAQKVLGELSRQPFLALVGASGSGKSSVLYAGVLAQLRQGAQIPESQFWWIGSFRPGARPLEALIRRLVDRGTSKEVAYQQEELKSRLDEGVEGFVYWLRSRPEPMVVLAIDQFEEIFTLAEKEEREQFVSLILGAIEEASDRFKVILTLRTDFIAPCLEIPPLARYLQTSSILIPPSLNEDDYRKIIVNPAEKVGLRVESELVEVLLQELNRGFGDLALLEFVLEQVWQQRQPGRLSLQVYQQQIGGLKGALEKKASAVYESLDDEAQACARWIFLALTQLGEGTEDTRRRVLKSQLSVAKYPAPLVDRTLQSLTAAKLLVVGLETEAVPVGQSRDHSVKLPDSETLLRDRSQEVTVEVAHEILIRHWSTLREWLQENRQRLRIQRQIEQAAAQWQQNERQPDFLLRGVQLASAEEIYLRYGDELSEEVRQFIEAGLQAREEAQKQTKRQLKQARLAAFAIALLALASVSFGLLAYRQKQDTRFKWINSLSSLAGAQLKANRQLDSLLAGVKAGQQLRNKPLSEMGFTPTIDMQMKTLATLQQALDNTQEINRLEGHSQAVNSVSFSPDGKAIASGSSDRTIKLWGSDGKLLKSFSQHKDKVVAVSFYEGGKTLATASADGTVNFWDIGKEKPLYAIENAGKALTSMAVTPKSNFLATASSDGSIKLWKASDRQLIKTLSTHKGAVNSILFSPDGQMLASAGEDGTVKLWKTSDGSLIKTLTGHKSAINSLAWSPDSKNIVAAGASGKITFFAIADGTQKTLQNAGDRVNDIAFSPNGKILAVADSDGTIALWSKEGILLATLKGHSTDVLNLDFSADGRQLVSASADNTIKLWQVERIGKPILDAASVSWSPDGKTIATTSKDGKIQLWQRDENGLKPLKTLDNIGSNASVVLFSPDGQSLASGGSDRKIRIWNLADGKLKQTLSGHLETITALAFSPDGMILASGDKDRMIRLWQPNNGGFTDTLTGHQKSITSLAFSPDGKILASSSEDKTIKLWQLNGTKAKTVKTLSDRDAAIDSLSFSPDGKILASANADNTISLWQVKEQPTLIKTAIGHLNRVTSINFSLDGKLLVSGSADKTIRLWNAESGNLIETLSGHSDTVSNVSFSPDDNALLSVSEKGGVQLWNLELDSLLTRSCDRLNNYLKNNINVNKSDRTVCEKLLKDNRE
jgi:WD40 repeat protein/uncharacterized caspase-like protein